MTARYDVTAIGNAIVDVIAQCDDAFLTAEGLTKNSMQLVTQDYSGALYSRMGQALETSGGSAGNTVAGVASFGGRAAYIGKVADDQLGGVFSHDIRASGVTFDTPVLKDGAAADHATLDAHCLNAIARFKRPKRYVFLEALPKNNYGKVLKTELRAQMKL